MEKPRVIQADYANWRTVAGRKVLQLTFEVPIEQTEDVMKKLGVPMPGESKWCAIALLDSPVAQRSEPPAHNGSVAGSNPAGATKEHKAFTTLPLSQQIGIRCNDATFQEFMKVETVDDAAKAVRRACAVESRAFIVDSSPAGSIWKQLERQYQSWITDRQFAGAKR